MANTMVRWTAAGALALAAAGVLGGFVPDAATAEAAGKSTKYIAPYQGNTNWAISLSSSGAVKGSFNESSNHWETGWNGSAHVWVKHSGTLTGTLVGGVVSVTADTLLERTKKFNTGEITKESYPGHFEYTATAAADAAGNLVLTFADGSTTTWYRQ